MSGKKFCTNCLYNGINPDDCYTHYPGKECPQPVMKYEDITCTRCNESGHFYKNCTSKQCRFCKNFGHIVKECPELASKLAAERGRWCSFCEESGHTVYFCNNSSNIKNIDKFCPFCRTDEHSLKECPSNKRQ
jgi:hypothetical protein